MKIINKKSILVAVIFPAFFSFLFLNIYCNSNSSNKIISFKDEYLNHDSSVKYVGIETCRSCHPSIYNSFIQTGMGQSFNIASRQKSAAEFSEHTVVYDKSSDMSYHPFFKNDSMYIMEFRLENRDTIYKRIEKVDYIIGSGQHTNSHMMNVSGYIYQLPLTWYAQKKKWDLPPGFENGNNVHFNRAIGIECMSCHNALPGFVENSLNKFKSVPRGIDCERCHGPGSLHVKEKLAGKIIDTANAIDYTIVNPKKLSFERQTDVCQRCHLQGNAIVKRGKTFFDFQPGMKLSDFIEVYMPKYKNHDDEFIMASHAQRLQLSKCFINSSKQNQDNSKAETITCITCHNPHVSVKVTGKQIFNNACNTCHSVKNSCKEDLKTRNEKNDDCVSCHMQKSGTIDIPHVTVTDHWIKIPAKKETINKLKEFAGIYCINNNHVDFDSKCEAYLNYFEKFSGEKSSLDSAENYFKFISKSDEIISKVHLYFLKNDFGKIVSETKDIIPESVSDAYTSYRIGQAFQNENIFTLSEKWYKHAILLAPDNLDFLNKYGAVLIIQNKINDGIMILEKSIQKNPKQYIAITDLGFAYLKKNDTAKAMELYNKALSLNPDFEQAMLNKAGLYNYLGKTTEAKNILKQILKHDSQNATVIALLKSI